MTLHPEGMFGILIALYFAKECINMKKTLLFLLLFALVLSSAPSALSHPGRTDSSGGHRDNKNASELGGYHFHCGKNPPHLHTDGCLYGGLGGFESQAIEQPADFPAQRPAQALIPTIGENETVLGRTNQRDVPVHERPDIDSNLLGGISQTGTAVTIIDVELDGDGDDWYRVKLEGEEGYILAEYIDVD